MESIEEKLNIDNEITVARKQLKDLLADLDIVKKEQATLESIKAKNVTLIEDQKNELRDTLLAINDAKNSWNQEKAQEEKKLDDKKEAIDAILARSSELDKQEAEINSTKIEVETIRSETKADLLAIEQGKTAIDVVKNEAQAREDQAKTYMEEAEKKVAHHKEKVLRVLNEIND